MPRASLDRLYCDYQPDIYRYLLSLCHDHHLAEDLTQETFFRAYLHFEEIQPGSLKPWLFRVAHHAYIDYWRKHRRQMPVPHETLSKSPVPERLEDRILLQDEVKQVMKSIAALPEKQKQAILLHDVHQFSYQESSEIMGVSLSHFKVLLFRARQKIRKLHKG